MLDAITQSLYAEQLSVIANGEPGTGATATCTLAATGGLRSATVKAGGTGYSEDDVLTVATGSGGTFRVTEVDDDGAVVSIVRTAAGTGYSSVDGAATTVAPEGGTDCTLVTVAEKAVGVITVGDGGEDYVTAVVKFSGGGNEGWEYGGSTVVDGEVTAVTAPVGIKYTSVPTITILSGGPANHDDLITAIKAYDTAQQNARVLEVLKNTMRTEVLTPEQSTIFADAIAHQEAL